IWIVGAIDSTNERNFILKRVVNRQIDTLTRALIGYVSVGSVFCTDGYPSYPSVARNLGIEHHVVNHSIGFVSPDGTHTNNIEGFWSTLKSEMRKQHGIKRNEIDNWLNEFTFRKRYLKDYDPIYLTVIFNDLIKILLN
ncbi:hypothetical protein H311_01194, partial [Anncaliia algerae PRA109]